jgi:diguanylate cyclase (GGDEF)-like protein/PAS domain S-box-containing protein
MTSSDQGTNPVCRVKAADERLAALSSLLSRLDEAAQTDGLSRTSTPDTHQAQLAKVRLGMASSLFAALRAKNAATAAHCLRVALGISSWASARQITELEQDECEIAALLHDVGKIGVPDHVLLKPGKLSADELLDMERQRQVGCDILRSCCSSTNILDIVSNAGAWFDGSKHGFELQGEDLPLGSRMIAIVDAFDAMTTDHIYRPAFSRERAVAELFECAGTQFDPELVREFCELLERQPAHSQSQVARRWLQQLSPDGSNSFWTFHETLSVPTPGRPDFDFHERLLETMGDGVVFINARLHITVWNRAAERVTGISATTVLGKQWAPSLLLLRDENGKLIQDTDCPAALAVRSGVQSIRRYLIGSRGDSQVATDLQIAPVIGHDGSGHGATIVLHDASSQLSLEERLQTLHERATRDALTKTANRAEFNRVLPEFMETHLREGMPCSMIICDIDHFKKINDTHGHQAGDEALVLFSALLLRSARAGDLVARYGGEEFVLLCADCDNSTATRRAEEIRKRVAATPMPSLGNRCISASFGVTEIQGGDTPETFLRRADRALLQAKDGGRNLVVQLGTGIGPEKKPEASVGWLRWFTSSPGEILLQRSLVTVVPLKVTAEKLRGFVADHHSEIVSVNGDRVTLHIDGQYTPLLRRTNDRPVPFLIELAFEEQRLPVEGRPNSTALRTVIHVIIRPKRQRDRRRRDAIERARQLLVSLKSYLMAQDHLPGPSTTEEKRGERDGILRKSKQILSYWLRK